MLSIFESRVKSGIDQQLVYNYSSER